jgi:hypothetical protein
VPAQLSAFKKDLNMQDFKPLVIASVETAMANSVQLPTAMKSVPLIAMKFVAVDGLTLFILWHQLLFQLQLFLQPPQLLSLNTLVATRTLKIVI